MLRVGKGIVPFVSKAAHAFVPCKEHVLSKIAKPGVLFDGFADTRSRFDNGLADRFDHGNLLPKRDSEFHGDEIFEVFSGCPGLFSHQSNGRWLVLIASVDHGSQEIVGG